jgi:hypothetical protein
LVVKPFHFILNCFVFYVKYLHLLTLTYSEPETFTLIIFYNILQLLLLLLLLLSLLSLLHCLFIFCLRFRINMYFLQCLPVIYFDPMLHCSTM